MSLRLWPRSLAARTAVVLLVGLVIVQVAGLTIHALDRIDLQRLAQARDVAVRVVSTYRMVMTTAPERRHEVVSQLRRLPGLTAELTSEPPDRGAGQWGAVRPADHPRQHQLGAVDGCAALARAAHRH